MRPDTLLPSGRRAGLTAVAAAAALLLSACSGPRPSMSGDTAGDSPAPVIAAPVTTVPVATTVAKAAPAATVAPSGDAELDQLDSDLAAFEQENSGLDQAAAATQEK